MEPSMDINVTTEEHFFAPLEEAMRDVDTRSCKTSDFDYMKHLVRRVIDSGKSGRDFVQKMIMTIGNTMMSVTSFFHALGSSRRKEMTGQAAEAVRGIIDRQVSAVEGSDPLKQHKELDGFAVYATDGHTHAASAHEKERQGKTYPTTNIFSLNLRTHTASHAVLLQPEENKKKEHEMKALKRTELQHFRMNQPTGVKVIHVYDPAVVDYTQWYNWKCGSGIYIITREKSNSALIETASNLIDKADPRNNGVISDVKLISSLGYALRRIVYCDPETGNVYRFLTNEMTLPPGLIAFLYRLRWDVEKLFDQFKNAMDEKKSWAASADAKFQQAQAIVTAHNLIRGIEAELKRVHGIEDEKVMHKRVQRLEAAMRKAETHQRPFNPLVEKCQRATKRSLQFVRWLRHSLEHRTYWCNAVVNVEPFMREYLQ